jgi:GMP synthase (glutamine-hydrolysing)
MKPIVILQNCEIESASLLGVYLEERKRPYTVVQAWRGDAMPTPDEMSHLIVLGTPTSVTEYRLNPFLVEEFKLITSAIRAKLPILGICFGAQFLAHALGAKVQANKVKEIGLLNVQLTEAGQADPLFAGFDHAFPVFQWHGDTWRNPFGTDWLVTSEDCKYQAFRRGVLVGLQFHLEADPNEIPAWCEAYAAELSDENLNAGKIIADAQAQAETCRTLGYRLLDNYFAIVREIQRTAR